MTRAAAGERAAERRGAFLELTKPRLLSLALATTLVGFFLGVEGAVDHGRLFAVLFGAALVGAGANAMNQLLEKEVDAKMRRTADRPLPSGRLDERQALVFGMAAAAAGSVVLFALVNPLTAFFGVLTFVSYVFLYTPLKRATPLNTFVGAVPGALPAVIGWAASGSPIGAEALALFLILFVWQLPHFYSIAWTYREDYLRGGLRMVTAGDPDGRRTAVRTLFYTALLLPVSLLPTFSGLAGWAYFLGASIAGTAFLALAVRLVLRRMEGSRGFMSASIVYLMVIIVILMADKA